MCIRDSPMDSLLNPAERVDQQLCTRHRRASSLGPPPTMPSSPMTIANLARPPSSHAWLPQLQGLLQRHAAGFEPPHSLLQRPPSLLIGGGRLGRGLADGGRLL